MKARSKWVITIAGLLLVVLGAVALTGRREPSYHGKSLSFWVMESVDGDAEAEEAFRAIGTDGLRFYLEWLPDRDTAMRRAKVRLASFRQLIAPHYWNPLKESRNRSLGSQIALLVLAERAAPAIPVLVSYVTNNVMGPNPVERKRPFECLKYIGEPAAPALLQLMTNTDPVVRLFSAQSAASMSTNAAVLRQLRAMSEQEDPWVRDGVRAVLEKTAPSP